jgi:hypothetical protein
MKETIVRCRIRVRGNLGRCPAHRPGPAPTTPGSFHAVTIGRNAILTEFVLFIAIGYRMLSASIGATNSSTAVMFSASARRSCLAVALIHTVGKPGLSQGHRSTRIAVTTGSSNNGENQITLIAESERTLNRNHPLFRGTLVTQVMFSDTQDDGIIRGENLHEGEDGAYRAYLLTLVQQLPLNDEQMITRHWIQRSEYMACRVALGQGERLHGCPPLPAPGRCHLLRCPACSTYMRLPYRM